VTRPGTPAAGDRLVCAVQLEAAATITASGWSLLGSDTNGGALRYFTRVASGSDPASWTFSWSGTQGACYACGCWSGLSQPTTGWATALPGSPGSNNTTTPYSVLYGSSLFVAVKNILFVPAHGGIMGAGATHSRDYSGFVTERLYRKFTGPTWETWVALGEAGESPYFSGPRSRLKTSCSTSTATRVNSVLNMQAGAPTPPPPVAAVAHDSWAMFG